MNAFTTYLQQFTLLSKEQASSIQRKIINKALEKDAFLLKAGEYCHYIAFITNGVFRIFFYDDSGLEVTRYFLSENQFAVNLDAFNHQTTSTEYIQAISVAEVELISRESFNSFSSIVPNWDEITRKITDQALLEKLNNRSGLVGKDAKSKYLGFLNNHPQLANRIPLGYLASYLGIKQQSLSRIRKEIAG